VTFCSCRNVRRLQRWTDAEECTTVAAGRQLSIGTQARHPAWYVQSSAGWAMAPLRCRTVVELPARLLSGKRRQDRCGNEIARSNSPARLVRSSLILPACVQPAQRPDNHSGYRGGNPQAQHEQGGQRYRFKDGVHKFLRPLCSMCRAGPRAARKETNPAQPRQQGCGKDADR